MDSYHRSDADIQVDSHGESSLASYPWGVPSSLFPGGSLRFILGKIATFFKYVLLTVQTSLIIGVLAAVIYMFYFRNDSAGADTFFWNFIIVTLVTDFLFLLLHLFRQPVRHGKLSFDPTKLTVVIACYNGEDIIEETIQDALVHVPANQIIVVSDASTDRTAQVAYACGARVFVNKRNINKAFSISSVVRWVETPYVLILDDDTLIGKTFIPTSLLDEGYSAVAFNVMPVATGKLVNKLQRFEYRKSMFFGKNLRAKVGAIGNISGAIGLYRTEDLQDQATRHSGQFGGEDQQRTALVHIYGGGKGVTYTDSIVETKAPNSLRSLFRQRAFRWNLSLPELFSVYLRIIFGLQHHYLLKIEKAYQIFLYVTDPLRVALIWMALLHPISLAVLYVFYFFLSLATWLKLNRQDPFWVILIFPFHQQAETVCRLIAHFYWFKIKFIYVFREKFYRLVTQRRVVLEYAFVAVFIAVIWGASVMQTKAKAESFQATRQRDAATAQAVDITLQEVESVVEQYYLPNNQSPELLNEY